jgi:hypothetical protein
MDGGIWSTRLLRKFTGWYHRAGPRSTKSATVAVAQWRFVLQNNTCVMVKTGSLHRWAGSTREEMFGPPHAPVHGQRAVHHVPEDRTLGSALNCDVLLVVARQVHDCYICRRKLACSSFPRQAFSLHRYLSIGVY